MVPWSYTLSTGVTSGHSGPSFVQDIDSRVDISVVNSSADGTLPLADRQRQLIQNIPAMVTSLAGREETIHLVDIRTTPFTLIFEHPSKGSPTRRSDGFCQPPIPDHTEHIQVLYADQSVATYQFCAQLLQEVPALIGNLFVLASKQDTSLFPSSGAFYSAGELTVQPFQLLLRLLQVTGIVSLPAFRCRQEGFDAEINPNLTASGWLFNHLNFTLDGHKVFSGLGFRHGDILWSAFQWSVKFGFDPTDFGQEGGVFIELETLGIADGLTVSFALEAWELRPLLKEVFVGPF